MQGGETFSTNTCCTWGVASNLVWAWHMECLPSAAKRRRLESHKVITFFWLGAWDLRVVRVIVVSELALGVVPCGCCEYLHFLSSLAPPGYNKMSRSVPVTLSRVTLAEWAEVKIMIGAVLKYSSSEDTLGWILRCKLWLDPLGSINL